MWATRPDKCLRKLKNTFPRLVHVFHLHTYRRVRFGKAEDVFCEYAFDVAFSRGRAALTRSAQRAGPACRSRWLTGGEYKKY